MHCFRFGMGSPRFHFSVWLDSLWMGRMEGLSKLRIVKNIEDKALPGIRVLKQEADKSLQRRNQTSPWAVAIQ